MDPSRDVSIVDLAVGAEDHMRQTSLLLYEGFRGRTESWQTLGSASEEVVEALAGNRINRIALDGHSRVVGWVGAIPMGWYPGGVWELHPLVVHARFRGKGLGRRLVTDLEERLREVGCRTVYLGSDDENFETSLSGVDLYRDLPRALANIESPGRHPLGFYARLGYTVVGVLPDANGPGKPDIFMAKRL